MFYKTEKHPRKMDMELLRLMRQTIKNGDLNLDGGLSEASEATKNPLFGAIYGNHFETVQFLVENGIDITVKYKIGKLQQCDAYEYARQFGRTQIANYLKE